MLQQQNVMRSMQIIGVTIGFFFFLSSNEADQSRASKGIKLHFDKNKSTEIIWEWMGATRHLIQKPNATD